MRSIIKHYLSDVDKYLMSNRQSKSQTVSQQIEANNCEKIAIKRDKQQPVKYSILGRILRLFSK